METFLIPTLVEWKERRAVKALAGQDPNVSANEEDEDEDNEGNYDKGDMDDDSSSSGNGGSGSTGGASDGGGSEAGEGGVGARSLSSSPPEEIKSVAK